MVAATTLRPGSLLTRDALTDQRLPAPGQQLVGVGVSAVQVPAPRCGPATRCCWCPWPVAEPRDASTTGTPRTVEATVVRSGPPGVDGLRVVDVLVDAADGPDVAARAAAGLIAIVVVAGE